MPFIRPLGRDIPEKTEYVLGFQKGLNKLQDESLIEDHELTTHVNGQIVVDGIQKRSGSINFGSSQGSRVYAGASFYTSGGNRFIIREGGTSLYYYNGSNTPTAISGATITTATRGEFVMARDSLFYVNPTDSMVKITVSAGVPVATTYTALSTPTGLAVVPQATTGSTRYSYRVSAINGNGETLAQTSVAITNGNATLSATNFNRLTWNAVTSATGYNVYGRKGTADNGLGETLLFTTTALTYDDTGVDTPSTYILPPEGNNTGGAKGSMIIYALSRLFVAGDTSNPSRLSYSAGGTLIDDFSSAHLGGWIDVAKNDGDSITGIFFYQNNIIVFKNRSIWKFSFTSAGIPQLELVTNEMGCCAFRTIKIVNNDLWFAGIRDGRLLVASLGYVKNYLATAYRTTEQSLNISSGSLLDSANLAYAPYACAYYYRNLYLLGVTHGGGTYNDRIYVFDSRFSAWAGYWTGMTPNLFFSYQDTSNSENLYYGDETTGYVVKMFTGSDDNGTAISWTLATKNFNQKYFDQYKIYRNPVLWFKDVSGGTITGFIVNDGIFNSGTFNISASISGISFGYDKWGTTKFGTSLGAATTTARSDQPMEIIFSTTARSLKIQLSEASGSGAFKFLGFSYKWTLLEGKPLPSINRIRLTA
jgi:hypothetical protein